MLTLLSALTLGLAIMPSPSLAAPVPVTMASAGALLGERSGDILSGLDVLDNLGSKNKGGLLGGLLHHKRSGDVLSGLDVANNVLKGNDHNADDHYYHGILSSIVRKGLLDTAGSSSGAGLLGVGNLLGVAGQGSSSGALSLLDGHSSSYGTHGYGYNSYPTTSHGGLTKILKREPSLGGGLLSAAGSGSSSGSGLLALGNTGLLGLTGSSSGSGVLSIGGKNGLLGTGLLAGKDGRYTWSAPNGWSRPTWYEFGYWHPDTGCWTYDQPSVLAYLGLQGYVTVESTPTYPLFPSSLVHTSRAADLSRAGKYGYFGQDGLFVELAVEVNALLGSCGYYNPKWTGY